MPNLGQFALQLSLLLCIYAILIDLLGSWKNEPSLLKSGNNALHACFASLSVAMVVLWILLLKCDFSVEYVASHTSKALPLAYKISALWAGASGSLLLWLWLQVGFIILVVGRKPGENIIFAARARIIANIVSAFFLLVMIFDKNPFAVTAVAPADGSGMNPLLQHPAMVLHPPTLFIGYAALAVPFVWAFSSLRHNNLETQAPFLKQVQAWILWAWMFLTIGIVLGAWWAYEELGWGGYWAWDPVENSSLMPWLTATALLHCSRTYNRKASMAVWFVIMSILTFSLCIFGTFLTRYGLVSGVHAFPDPGLGILFMVSIAVLWVIAIVMLSLAFKNKNITIENKSGGGLKFIIVNNWLMLLLTLVIFVGTLFPFFSGLFTDQKITLKPEYFTKITSPCGLFMLFLIGICPHLLLRGLKRDWRLLTAAMTAEMVIILAIIEAKLSALCIILCVFACLNWIADFIERYKSKRAGNSLKWYGTRIVHIGVIMVFLGISGGGYSQKTFQVLKTGQHMVFGKYKLVYEKMQKKEGPNYTAYIAEVSVYDDNVPNAPLLTKLYPSKAEYHISGKATTEVDIKRSLALDLYTALEVVDPGSQMIKLRVLINPLINWVWIGSTISMIGTVMVLIPFYRKRSAD